MIKNNNITKIEKKLFQKNRFIFLEKDLIEIRKIFEKKIFLFWEQQGLSVLVLAYI